MFRRKSLPVGVLVMVLVLALVSLGMGYGLWSKILTIDGTVNTGTLDAIFVDAFTDDDDVVDNPDKDSLDLDNCPDIFGLDMDGDFMTSCDPAASGIDPKARHDKDVARCDAGIDPDDNQIGFVIKRNVYPGYFCTAWFDVKNNGKIPVRVAAATVNGLPIDPSVPTPFDLNNDGVPDVAVHLTGLTSCQQIDADETVQIDIDQEVLQGAPQGATLSYTVKVQLNQWNEPCP